MSNTPSEELRLLLQEARSALWQPANAELCERIDDALARWGTPQPVVRESSEDLYWELHGLSKILEGSGLIDESRNPDAYTTILDAMAFVRWAQPVVRGPLTDEQIKELIEDGVFLGNCKEIVRAIELAHGITQKVGSNAE